MIRFVGSALIVLVAVVVVSGCSNQGTPKVETQEVKVRTTAIDQAKTILQQYANGQAPGSEADSFDALVAEAKQVDPAKGEILEKGLAEIKKSPATAQQKAKEMLPKL